MARLIPKWYKGPPEAIDPDCLRQGNQRKDPHFGNDGYFLPCCECDPPGSRSCFEERGFFDKELHISNIKKREDFAKIFDSKAWKKFRSTLFEDPKNAPYICQVFCKKSKQKVEGHGKNPKGFV